MKDEKAENPDDTYAAVGYVVSLLLKSGKPIHMHDITALLKQNAENAADPSLKNDCVKAIRLIAEKMN